MRILAVHRQPGTETALLVESLAAYFGARGREYAVEDASDWMPKETGPRVDPAVGRKLGTIAESVDLIHAWGYRVAWACGESLRRRRWIFSALRLPKTDHPELMARLNRSRLAIAFSRSLKAALGLRYLRDVRVLSLGVPPSARADRAEARARLGLAGEHPTAAFWGGVEADDGLDEVLEAWVREVHRRVPDARLAIGGGREPGWLADRLGEAGSSVLWTGPERPGELAAATDLAVLADPRGAGSLFGVIALASGTPLLARRDSAGADLVEERRTGFLSSEDLGRSLAGALQAPLTLESMRLACRIRAEEQHDFEEFAERLWETCAKVLA